VDKECRCAPSIRETSALSLSGEVSFVVVLAFFQRAIGPEVFLVMLPSIIQYPIVLIVGHFLRGLWVSTPVKSTLNHPNIAHSPRRGSLDAD
jgi:hypothetical protein